MRIFATAFLIFCVLGLALLYNGASLPYESYEEKANSYVLEEEELSAFLRKYRAELVFSEDYEGGRNEFYHSNRLGNSYSTIRGEVNIQIAYCDNGKIIVGLPLLWGSY